jgi:hypothetical protein
MQRVLIIATPHESQQSSASAHDSDVVSIGRSSLDLGRRPRREHKNGRDRDAILSLRCSPRPFFLIGIAVGALTFVAFFLVKVAFLVEVEEGARLPQ